MKNFEFIKSISIDEAVQAIKTCEGKAYVKAGGTDLMGGLKREIHEIYPEKIVDIYDIKGLDYITEEGGFVKIGSLTTLKEIAQNPMLQESYTVLAEAARRTASPHLRTMGTVGGNICQENRCWYYRAKDNFFPCKMKGGKKCFAPLGDNRIHSIFGAVNGCFAVNPSDTAPAFVALDAEIVTTDRIIKAAEFWTASVESCTVLERGELVKEIRFPVQAKMKSAFLKHALRPTIDFPILNCAIAISAEKVRICLNGIYPTPLRMTEAEDLIFGKEITEEFATEAADLALSKAKPLSCNVHKVQIAKAYIKTLLLACK